MSSQSSTWSRVVFLRKSSDKYDKYKFYEFFFKISNKKVNSNKKVKSNKKNIFIAYDHSKLCRLSEYSMNCKVTMIKYLVKGTQYKYIFLNKIVLQEISF